MADERYDLVDLPRLGANSATERYQPHHGVGTIKEQPLITYENGLHSIIRRGPTGIGASFAFTEPVGHHHHETIGAEPLVSRPAGA